MIASSVAARTGILMPRVEVRTTITRPGCFGFLQSWSIFARIPTRLNVVSPDVAVAGFTCPRGPEENGMHTTTVADILKHKGSQVVTVGPDDSILAAALTMKREGIGALVVVEGGPRSGLAGSCRQVRLTLGETQRCTVPLR